MQCTKDQLSFIGTDERVGRITVTLHTDDIPENGDSGSVLNTTDDGQVTIAAGVRVVIIDGHHLHAAIGELRNDMKAM